MRLRLEKRLEPSRTMLVMTPVLSVIAIMILGVIIFDGLGYDGPQAVWELFFTPVLDVYKWRDVASKAAPLIIIALGLSLGNQAKIWNIGAEGQYILGALSLANRQKKLGCKIVAVSLSSPNPVIRALLKLDKKLKNYWS